MVLPALLAGCTPGEDLPTPKAIAERLDCLRTFEPTRIEGLVTVRVGTCRFSGRAVRLLVFESTDARNAFAELTKSSGARYVEGNEFLVEVPDARTQRRVASRL